ncbi:unnamed protein product [Dovyalis caffra]|uniref:Fe2OG dioxygenase domain-containing protein n=1 Tax=Dovyalis caffra TaxID=77055 RepID=A0AAV1SV72_9ROSI|nr:unnamed protein product [Dovyalis caffra]
MDPGRGRGRGRGRSPGGGDHPGSRGKSSRPSSHSSHRHRPLGADGSSSDEKPFSSRDAMSQNRKRNSLQNPRGGFSRYPGRGTPLGCVYRPKTPLGNGLSIADDVEEPNKSLEDSMSSTERLLPIHTAPSCSSIGSNQSDCSVASNSVNEGDSALMPAISGSLDMQPDTTSIRLEEEARDGAANLDFSDKLNIVPLQNQTEPHLPFQAGVNDQLSQEKCSNNAASGGDSEQQAVFKPFDICLPNTGTTFKLKPSLLVKNREKRNEVRCAKNEVQGEILRSGMVLLKNYLRLDDQKKIVKLCRDIGLGPGGFYQPIYRDGGRMHLKMMSLGKSWNPDRSEYVEHRPIDGAAAPTFPSEFYPLVERAIKASRVLIERNDKSTCAEDILPSLSPNICVVNFYSQSGRLGLHQDKDESQDSLRKGLPVVSFSIGDAGDFLFGDQRDVEKAKNVLLESGDVLVFGGKSRHIFHGNVGPRGMEHCDLQELERASHAGEAGHMLNLSA